MSLEVRKNEKLGRYEAVIEGSVVGIADYLRTGDVIAIPHTEVNPERRGQGLAAELVRAALDAIRAQGASFDPQCSYVADFIRLHPAYADLRVGH
jgi:predicted GNAT family acetyltransferase